MYYTNILTGKSFFSEADSVSVDQEVWDFIAQKFHTFPPLGLTLYHINQGHCKGLVPTRHSSCPSQNTLTARHLRPALKYGDRKFCLALLHAVATIAVPLAVSSGYRPQLCLAEICRTMECMPGTGSLSTYRYGNCNVVTRTNVEWRRRVLEAYEVLN